MQKKLLYFKIKGLINTGSLNLVLVQRHFQNKARGCLVLKHFYHLVGGILSCCGVHLEQTELREKYNGVVRNLKIHK